MAKYILVQDALFFLTVSTPILSDLFAPHHLSPYGYHDKFRWYIGMRFEHWGLAEPATWRFRGSPMQSLSMQALSVTLLSTVPLKAFFSMVFTGPRGTTFTIPGNLTLSPCWVPFFSLVFFFSSLLFFHHSVLDSFPLHSHPLCFPSFLSLSLPFFTPSFALSLSLILSLLVFLSCLVCLGSLYLSLFL